MPFSSVLGASSVVKPGVCTSTTRPTVPYVGQLIFETDTNRLVVWNGSSWVYLVDSDSPPGLELVKTQTIGNAVTSVTVSDAFNANYDNYLITINGGSGSTNASLHMTLGSTATGYYYGANWVSYTGSSGVFSGANIARLEECCYFSANAINMQMVVKSPFLADRTFFNWQVSGAQTSGVHLGVSGGGYLNDDTSYTSFTLTTSSGNVTGGTIRVYGYRNS